MIRWGNLYKALLALVVAGFQVCTGTASDEALLTAAQRNDLPGVISALEQGANINAQSRGQATATMFAARNRNFEMVKLLVQRRADLVQDAFFLKTAVEEAIALGDVEDGSLPQLKRSTARRAQFWLSPLRRDLPLLQSASRRPDIPDFVIGATHAVAVRKGETEAATVLASELDHRPEATKSLLSLSSAALQRFTGMYRDDRTAQSITVTLQKDQLIAILGPRSLMLFPFSETGFRAPEMPNTVFSFFPRSGQATRMLVGTRALNLDLRRRPN